MEFANEAHGRHSRALVKLRHVVPMFRNFAPLVPLALTLVLAACASHTPQTPATTAVAKAKTAEHAVFLDEAEAEAVLDFADDEPYELPQLADSILSHGLSLVGTRYRYGGSTVKSGFDCSGFIGYLFKEELGMQLPRSTREMIKIDAPLVEREALEPGDLLFFSTNGGGRVSHAGIYLGDDQFIFFLIGIVILLKDVSISISISNNNIIKIKKNNNSNNYFDDNMMMTTTRMILLITTLMVMMSSSSKKKKKIGIEIIVIIQYGHSGGKTTMNKNKISTSAAYCS